MPLNEPESNLGVMDNYILFKQIFSLILFIETLVVWPRFSYYFGPQVFPRSIFTTPVRIHIFHVFLLICLVFIFCNYFSVVASFILAVCMRYLFVTDAKNRISTLGAVGHLCFIISAYIFFFDAAFLIDPTHQLTRFLHTILAIEIGTIMMSAGLFKWVLGYFKGNGLEYALVNPSWGKLFFFFNKLRPSSWFIKIHNHAAFALEILSGALFFFPQTRIYGSYLLIAIFTYVFLTVRANILPFLMMALSLLYIPTIPFHFPILHDPIQPYAVSSPFILVIKAMFIVYLIIYILFTLFRLYQLKMNVCVPAPLVKPLHFLRAARPFFEWSVFTVQVTDYFITVSKASKTTQEITDNLYDGFSKHYQEFFEDPALFLRFSHHHESSFSGAIFLDVRLGQITQGDQLNGFIKRMANYASTFLSQSELENTLVVFTLVHIRKIDDRFRYTPLARFFIDVQSGKLAYAEEISSPLN